MAVITIQNGDLPAQDAQYLAQHMIVKTSDGGQRTYFMKAALVSIEYSSDHNGNTVFHVELKDGLKFRCKTKTKIYHELLDYIGLDIDEPYITEELTPEEAKKSNRKIKLFLWIAAGLLLWWIFGNGDQETNHPQSPQQAEVVKQQPRQTYEEALSEYVGSWKTATQKSKLDDSQNVYIALQADEPIQTPYKGMIYPKMIVRCAENKTSMIISFDTFLSNDDIKVMYRIDKEKARTVWWNVTTDFDSLYVPNPIPLLRKLKDEDQIYIKVTPYGQNPISANFYVHGLFNAIKSVQDACGWK